MARADRTHVLAYDIGTTGNKTCLYAIGETIEQVHTCVEEYPLFMTPGGGAEQRADDWWAALGRSTRRMRDETGIDPVSIKGIAFCCQMQGSIFVDREGRALRNPMIYMDARATRQIERALHRGPFRIENINAFKLLPTLWITGGMAATAKDPLWKYHWVRENEPDVFRAAHKWLDVKDALTTRCTGRITQTQDSANVTFVYDTRPGHLGWSDPLCRLFHIEKRHLPDVLLSTDVVGGLTAGAASDLGLAEGTPVFGGGGDVSCISLGAGCTELNDAHIYVGTSGWVATNVDRRMVDIGNFIASILGAMPGRYNYIAEQETAGLCLQWVRDHLAKDEIGVYLNKRGEPADTRDPGPLYDLLNNAVEDTPPGAGGVIFTPWLHGNRAPREDPYARGMFFNIGLETGKRRLVRAVLEGVAYHARWMLEAAEKKVPRRETLRFVGGGAKSETWCRIMADVTGRVIETIDRPQDAGAAGAAMIAGVGLGVIPSFERAKDFVPVAHRYEPRPETRRVYDEGFAIFKDLYAANRELFRRMNRTGE